MNDIEIEKLEERTDHWNSESFIHSIQAVSGTGLEAGSTENSESFQLEGYTCNVR